MDKLFMVEALITQYHGATDFAKDHYRDGVHRGLDVNPINRKVIPEHSPFWNIYSPMNGAVVEAGYDEVYGYNCIVYNESRRASLHFAHMKSLTVKKGAGLWEGEKLGIVGNTGNSTARHLHIGYIPMRPYGNRLFDDAGNPYNGAIDPLGFLIGLGVNI